VAKSKNNVNIKGNVSGDVSGGNMTKNSPSNENSIVKFIKALLALFRIK